MNTLKATRAAVLAAFVLASASVLGAEPPPITPTVPAPSVAPRDKLTLQRLHDGNQTQIQMGKLAQDKGANRDARDLGRRLVDDFTVADRKIDAYLRTRGTDLTALGTTVRADTDHELVTTKAGADFDRAFAQQTRQDLQQLIDLLNSERIATADDSLRQLYDALTPTIESDRRAAEELLVTMSRS